MTQSDLLKTVTLGSDSGVTIYDMIPQDEARELRRLAALGKLVEGMPEHFALIHNCEAWPNKWIARPVPYGDNTRDGATAAEALSKALKEVQQPNTSGEVQPAQTQREDV